MHQVASMKPHRSMACDDADLNVVRSRSSLIRGDVGQKLNRPV